MGTKLTTVDKRVGPPPDTYEINQHFIGKNSSKFGFGSEKRAAINAKSISPGPGAYVHKSKAFNIEKPRFFMGEKIAAMRETTVVPGAGTYNGNYHATKT